MPGEPDDPTNEVELGFEDEDDEEPAQPGDTIIDFSTDPPTVWTVPEEGADGPADAEAASGPVETFFFPVGGTDSFKGTVDEYLVQGEGEWAAEGTTTDGRPAIVIDDGLMADLLPDEAGDFGMTVHVFTSATNRATWVASQPWGVKR